MFVCLEISSYVVRSFIRDCAVRKQKKVRFVDSSSRSSRGDYVDNNGDRHHSNDYCRVKLNFWLTKTSIFRNERWRVVVGGGGGGIDQRRSIVATAAATDIVGDVCVRHIAPSRRIVVVVVVSVAVAVEHRSAHERASGALCYWRWQQQFAHWHDATAHAVVIVGATATAIGAVRASIGRWRHAAAARTDTHRRRASQYALARRSPLVPAAVTRRSN